ncbi:MAG TPA: aminoacyl-tRNA hydrolase [Flavobacterium sp.]|nr:aminoacyl-tRNA hydrolase [Flavobacterium sp.]
MNFFKKWFGSNLKNKEKDTEDDFMKKYLIVGLGNIGSEYVNTRHNIGFKAVDFIAKEADAAFETVKLGTLAQVKIKGRTLLLLKPNTYMNLSGKAVQHWMEKEKIARENILIITDDLNLPFGTLRIKGKGSDGGHNGLKSIQAMLNGTEYPRLRFGISDQFKKGQQVDYVLGDWGDEETAALPERLEMVSKAVKEFVLAGLNNAMNNYNGK